MLEFAPSVMSRLSGLVRNSGCTQLTPTGKINAGQKALKTCPFFFMSPEIIRKNEKKLQGTSMPVYFTPWLHEYCHFIGYCLQKRPIAVALSILYADMLKESSNGLSFRDIKKLTDTKNDEISTNVAETIFYLHWLDESMANFLQELLLQELGFDPGNYFVELMQENPFYPYFKEWGKERFVKFIADWNNAKIKAPQFIKSFLKSFDEVKIERCPIGSWRERTEVGGQVRRLNRFTQIIKGRKDMGRGLNQRKDGWISGKNGIIKTEVSDQGSGVGKRQRADDGGQMTEGYLSGKRVAIVGAGSIIGRRLAREVAGYGPKRLILVGHDENGLVKIQNELIENYPYLSHEVALTHLSDTNNIAHIFNKHEPQTLFHTDTWRHPAFTERQPLDAVNANFLATRRLADMAGRAGVQRFIFISTLKAAYPRLCFSVSYKMAELCLEEMSTGSRTRFISVRLGNVLEDEAIFVKFLKRGITERRTVTLPVPDKKFWFLPIEKAAQLVIKAGGMGEGGEVFSLDRGVRLSMRTIAKDLCYEEGLVPERDVEFISDPSKWDRWLIEELSLEDDPYPEKERPTAFSHIRIVETESYGWDKLKGEVGEIERLFEEGDEEGLIERLEVYFPDYRQ